MIDVVEKYGEKTVNVSVSNNAAGTTKFSIRTTNGTGNATFEDGSSEVIVNGNTTNQLLKIKGVIESSEADNVIIEAKLNNSSTVSASDVFTVAVIESLEFERINSDDVVDANPGTDGVPNPDGSEGLRIFPDIKSLPEPSPTIDRSLIRVTANVLPSLPAGVKVYFASFDIDDPSSSPVIDPNPTGDDNFGSSQTTNSKSGDFSVPPGGNCTSVTTATNISRIGCDVNGTTASTNYKVTMQPGDNFAVAATFSETYRNGIVLNSTDGTIIQNAAAQPIPASGALNPNNVAGLRTGMLTTWRRLHIEVDSMKPAHANYERGNISGAATINRGRSRTLNVQMNSAARDQFRNGRLVLAPITAVLMVVSNTANTITVKNTTSSDIVLPNDVDFELLATNNASDIGRVTNGQTITPGQTVVLNIAGAELVTNLYSNGDMFITPMIRHLTITGNTETTIDVVNNTTMPIVIADLTHVRIYDDDDYNSNDTAATLDGDENEAIVRFGDTFRHLSPNLTGAANYADGTPTNVLRSVYIVPEYEWAEDPLRNFSQSHVVFDKNLEDMAEFGGVENANRDSRTYERDNFWIAYFIIGYQGNALQDHDGLIPIPTPSPSPSPAFVDEPTQEGVTGTVDIQACDCYQRLTACPTGRSNCSAIPIGGNTSLVYEESIRDISLLLPINSYPIRESQIAAPHELGHQFGLRGDLFSLDFAIMDYPNNNMSTAARVAFNDEHINLMRRRIKSPGN